MAFALALPFSGALAGQSAATPDAAVPAPTGQVEREVLASSEPDAAPEDVFELSRYTIPAGAVLPVHTHPGDQLSTIISGTLTYHIVANGEVSIVRADGTEEVAVPGDLVTLSAGDTVAEPEGMVHWAENLTDEPIVLLSASLFEADEPASTIYEATPAA
jgi:quercetin dioxygenase-like cupin family protein